MVFPLFDRAEQGKSGSAVCTYVHFYFIFIIAKKPVREDGLFLSLVKRSIVLRSDRIRDRILHEKRSGA